MPDLPLDDSIVNMALGEIDLFLQSHGKRLTYFSDMPQLNLSAPSFLRSLIEEEELCYNRDELRIEANNGVDMMNEGQRDIWNCINHALDAQKQGTQLQVRIKLSV
jgi:hypothetical protein